MSIQYKWAFIGAAVALVGMFAFGAAAYYKGHSDGKAKIELAVLQEKQEWQDRVSELQSTYQERVIEIVDKYNNDIDQYKQEIARLTQNPIVVKEYVNRYIPKETQCTVPEGFVQLHNRSATGQSLNDSPTNVADPSERTLADVGNVVAQNYFQCNIDAARLKALQELVKKYQEQQKELVK